MEETKIKTEKTTLQQLIADANKICKKYGWTERCSMIIDIGSRKDKPTNPEYRMYAHHDKIAMFSSKRVNSPKALLHALETHLKAYSHEYLPKDVILTP